MKGIVRYPWLKGICALACVLLAASASAAGYTAKEGRLYDPDGQPMQIRGISHFGFGGKTLQPQFLWAMNWRDQLAQIKSLGFNAIRVPFVPDTLHAKAPARDFGYFDPSKNPEFVGKTPLQILDIWMAEADRMGLYLMLDFHSVSMQRQYPTWFVSNPADFNLVYNKKAYTKDDWIADLVFVAKRYEHLNHFFAIDIYNEPNSVIRWSTGDSNITNPAYFWKSAAEQAAKAILAANPNLLIFVQGINGNFDGVENPTSR